MQNSYPSSIISSITRIKFSKFSISVFFEMTPLFVKIRLFYEQAEVLGKEV